MQKTQLFSTLPGGILDKLTEGLTIKPAKAGTKIIQKGEKVGSLIVIVEGAAQNSSAQKFKSGQLICEDSLRDMSRGGIHEEDIVMTIDGVIG